MSAFIKILIIAIVIVSAVLSLILFLLAQHLKGRALRVEQRLIP
jgi:archaellin